jgi:hypothetical protein
MTFDLNNTHAEKCWDRSCRDAFCKVVQSMTRNFTAVYEYRDLSKFDKYFYILDVKKSRDLNLLVAVIRKTEYFLTYGSDERFDAQFFELCKRNVVARN